MNNVHGQIKSRESGMTIVGLLFILVIVGLLFVVVAQVTPTVVEYMSIKKAMISSKSTGNSVQEIQNSFNKQAEIGYITSIKGSDLTIERVGNEIEVSFAYTKKIPLFGPASLVIEYEGTTAKSESKSKIIE
jgi:type II secretory pathway pseudopilin PulG